MKKLFLTLALALAPTLCAAAPMDEAGQQCEAANPGPAQKDYQRFVRVLNCVERHANASDYTAQDRLYLAKQHGAVAAVESGAPWRSVYANLRSWRAEQIASMAQAQETATAYAQEQRAMRNSVESIPGQQAMWTAYFRQMDSMSRGYNPQITGNGYRSNVIGVE